MPKTKMVRVSEDEWQLLKRAREEIQRSGYASLEDLEDQLEKEGEASHIGELLAGFALGAVAAVGAAAILKILSDAAQSRGQAR